MPAWRFCLCLLAVACVPSLPDEDDRIDMGDVSADAGACGRGTWQSGWLEIHHIDAGEAVATLLVSPVGRTMLIDAGEADWDRDEGAQRVGAYLRRVLGCRHLDYALISHFHVDHVGFPGYGGLWHLVARQGFVVDKLLHRDLDRFPGGDPSTVHAWRNYLQSSAAQALAPEVAAVGRAQASLGGGVEIAFVSVDADGLLPAGDLSAAPAPPDENDFSIAALVRFGQLDYFTAGDLSGQTLVSSSGGYSYHDGETAVARRTKAVDVYRVSHHGSSHASNATLLAQIDPEVAILQVGDGNRSGHPARATLQRLLATSTVYLTERGAYAGNPPGARVVGDIVLRTADGLAYTVAGDAFTARDPVRLDSDQDGYYSEADPDDHAAGVVPGPNGPCDARYTLCP